MICTEGLPRYVTGLPSTQDEEEFTYMGLYKKIFNNRTEYKWRNKVYRMATCPFFYQIMALLLLLWDNPSKTQEDKLLAHMNVTIYKNNFEGWENSDRQDLSTCF
jgi:hypothetical protein